MIDIEIFRIKERFLSCENTDIAMERLFTDLLNFFDIDRIFIGMKDVAKNECVAVMEYEKGKGQQFFGDVIDFNSFIRFSSLQLVDADEENYMKLCQKKECFVKDEVKDIQDILKNVGYRPSFLGMPKECIVQYIKNKEFFSYMLMERYGEQTPFTDDERMVLRSLYYMLKMRIEKDMLEKRFYDERNMKDAIIANENMPICMVDKVNQSIVYYNELYKKILPDIRLGVSYHELFDDEEHHQAHCLTESFRIQTHLGSRDKYWINKCVPFTLCSGDEVYMIYAKDTEDYIKQLDGIDLLTSAYSIKGFTEHCEKVIASQNLSYVLCTMDIDKFKYINDAFGFHVGNELLKKVASVINQCVQKTESFCRMSEDKFALLLECGTQEEVQGRFLDLYKKLEAMQQEHFLDMKLTFISGATQVDKEIPINILLDRANNARKTAKGSHKSKVAFFDKVAEQKEREETRLEKRVSKAVKDGEFIPYLQPKFELSTKKICGAEALVRWVTPTGMIYPDNFIPLFERNGFIDTLDFIVYQKVMEHIRNFLDRNLKVYPISLNVSRNHIQNKNFVNQIMELIHQYDIPVELLELEVTESIFVEDKEVLKYFIENIKRPKIKVSIDDFGTAYSSLQVLKDIDIDILKIDKGFLENIDFSDAHQFTKDEVVLKNIINLARDLDCKVICEGIETDEQIKLLENIGCEYGQGYVFAKPMPIAEYEDLFLMKE